MYFPHLLYLIFIIYWHGVIKNVEIILSMVTYIANSYFSSRDMFNVERAKLRAEVEKLQKELSLTKLTLKKELEWKDSFDNKYHSLLLEKRDLLYQ